MSPTKEEDQYKERMIRGSQLEYLFDDSPFRELSVENFETWKSERPLLGEERTTERLRRKEIKIICEIYLEAYRANQIALVGKAGLLDTLKRICTRQDQALLGRIVWEALSHRSSKGRGRSAHPTGLKKFVRARVQFLKTRPKHESFLFGYPKQASLPDGKIAKFPGKSDDERMALILARLRKLGLRDLNLSHSDLKEIYRVRELKIKKVRVR